MLGRTASGWIAAVTCAFASSCASSNDVPPGATRGTSTLVHDAQVGASSADAAFDDASSLTEAPDTTMMRARIVTPDADPRSATDDETPVLVDPDMTLDAGVDDATEPPVDAPEDLVTTARDATTGIDAAIDEVIVDVVTTQDTGAPLVDVFVAPNDVPQPVDVVETIDPPDVTVAPLDVEDVFVAETVDDVPALVDEPAPLDEPAAPDVPDPTDATDTPLANDDGASTDAGPSALPPFDDATDAHVRALVTQGLAAGNDRTVFAKIGDSITESWSFMHDCGVGWYDVGTYADVGDTIAYFAATRFPDGTNSMNRASVSAVAGWTIPDAITGGDSSPLAQELATIHPMWAVIMYGTNDLDHYDTTTFIANYNTLLDMVEARGVVPILSTIPERLDDPTKTPLSDAFSDAVRTLAATRHEPLIDYQFAMGPLPSHGVSSDGIHPSLYSNTGCYFTTDALAYGYNVRNLTALQMLERLRAY